MHPKTAYSVLMIAAVANSSIIKPTSVYAFGWVSKDGYAALKQLSQVPYFELKLPPPLCCACSAITARAQTSQVLAISPSDIGCERVRSDILNFDFAFTERSSYSSLWNRIWDQKLFSSENIVTDLGNDNKKLNLFPQYEWGWKEASWRIKLITQENNMKS